MPSNLCMGAPFPDGLTLAIFFFGVFLVASFIAHSSAESPLRFRVHKQSGERYCGSDYKEQHLERTRVVRACRATRATRGEGDFLRIGAGAPLLEEHRVSYCIKNGKETPFEYLLAVYTEGVTLLFEWFEQLKREAGK